MRLPSLRRTWWKATSFSSVAEYRRTGIVTRPNETVPFQIDRMGLLPVHPRVQAIPGRARDQDRTAHGYVATMSPAEERVPVVVDSRQLTLSNLGKVLYPPVDGSPGFSKAEV